MSIFKDLGFVKQGGVLTLPDCSKIGGLTEQGLIDSVTAQVLSTDIDGLISIQGTSLPITITQDNTQANWRGISVKAFNPTSDIIINGETLIVKSENAEYKIYESILTNTRVLDVQGNCSSIELTLYT